MVKQRPSEGKQGKVNDHPFASRRPVAQFESGLLAKFYFESVICRRVEWGWWCRRIAVKPCTEPHTMPSLVHGLRPGKRSARDFAATRRDRCRWARTPRTNGATTVEQNLRRNSQWHCVKEHRWRREPRFARVGRPQRHVSIGATMLAVKFSERKNNVVERSRDRRLPSSQPAVSNF